MMTKRRQEKKPLRRVVNKKQETDKKRKHIQEKQSEESIEKSRRQSATDGLLVALHPNVIDFLHVTADISRHEIIEKKPDKIKLHQVCVAHPDILPVKQELPL